nr:hypothetical protein HK105_005599 [Polyrhizophydium stewartii]
MPTRATVLGLLALAAVAAPAAWVLALPRRRRDNVLRTLVFESVLGYAALRMLEPPAGAEPHRRTEREPPLSSGPFEVLVVPSLQDNYAYVVADRDQGTWSCETQCGPSAAMLMLRFAGCRRVGTAVIIDPSDAKAIFEVLREHSLRPLAILNTHKHWDHCSGNLRIVAKFPGIDVYGSALDFGALSLNRLFQRTTHFVVDNDVLTIGRFVFRVILAPCHTRGSVLFLLDMPKSLAACGISVDKAGARGDVALSPGDGHATGDGRVTAVPASNVSGEAWQDQPDSASAEPSMAMSAAPPSLFSAFMGSAIGRPPGTQPPDPSQSHGRNRIPSGDAPQSINMLDLDPARARELSESLVPVPTSLTDWHPFAPSLFTGDTLMTAGCGRFFEAESAYDMHQIAARLIATLPPDTNLFPGHEYSIANLAFARLLEPGNFTLQLKFKQAEDAAWLRTAMVPTTLQEEALYNPFLRLDARGRRGELWRNVMRQAALLRASDSTEPILDVVRRETVAACAAHGLTGSTLDEAIAIGCLRALKDRCRFKDGKAEL